MKAERVPKTLVLARSQVVESAQSGTAGFRGPKTSDSGRDD